MQRVNQVELLDFARICTGCRRTWPTVSGPMAKMGQIKALLELNLGSRRRTWLRDTRDGAAAFARGLSLLRFLPKVVEVD